MTRRWQRIKSRFNRYFGCELQYTLCYEITKDHLGGDPPTPPGIHVARLDADNVDVICEVWPENIDEMRSRLQEGHLCYVAFLDGRPVHYSWVQRAGVHNITEAATSLVVAPGEFWIYHCRTVEFAKGKGIYPTVLTHIVRDHFADRYVRGRIYTEDENVASQRGILKAGFRPEIQMRALRVGLLRFRLHGQ
jgi:RimJ/RimL family protein N-acetyltransferase